MREMLCVPEEMRRSVAAFAADEGIPIEVVSTGECNVCVVRSGERTESDASTLCAGGWIGCACARATAIGLKITPKQMGRLLNRLDIKVRQCELGLF